MAHCGVSVRRAERSTTVKHRIHSDPMSGLHVACGACLLLEHETEHA